MIEYQDTLDVAERPPRSWEKPAATKGGSFVDYRPEPTNPNYTVQFELRVFDQAHEEPESEWVKWHLDYHRHAARAELMNEIAVSGAAKRYPLWLNVGSLLSIVTLLASLVFAFIDGHTAVGLAALAFCGIWLFGSAAERLDLE